MGLRINQNIAAQNAYRNLSVTDNQMSKSLEKLSSGFRINRAADDAAGLSISEGLRSQVGGLKVAVRNAQDAISVVQTAEGALNETTSMLQRMRDLAVQANNASLDAEAKNAAQAEFSQLRSEIDRVSDTTSFGKSKLLDGSFGNTQGLSTASPAVLADGDALGIKIDELNGVDVSALDIKASVTASVNTPAEAGDTTMDSAVADMNKQLSDALKTAGYNGDEITVSAKMDADKKITWQVNSAGGQTFKTDGTDTTIVAASTSSAARTGATPGDFQIGANADEKLNISIGAVNSQSLGLRGLDLTTAGTAASAGVDAVPSGAEAAITALDKAITTVSDQRAKLGASQNRFEHTINNLNTAVENLSASESRIRDTDMAQEMVSFTRNQILTQAGTSMLAQANQSSQGVLSLLR
ncbi:putative flagellin domain protein [Actinoplanes missouriensis 431]|uniref:Flagellin n=2 Tax=Actinoplanes TaxID=1865 RepID=I0HIK2_ACTM4|nr:flagellin [Actinoplanes missouriensis]BAL92839.1 putative flagellin domain protein [Actinoplanes missouriensis 431]